MTDQYKFIGGVRWQHGKLNPGDVVQLTGEKEPLFGQSVAVIVEGKHEGETISVIPSAGFKKMTDGE